MISDSIHAITYAWGALAVFWAITAIRVKRSLRREPAPARIFHLLFMAIAFALLFRSDVRVGPLAVRVVPPSAESFFIGVGVPWLGTALAIWARAILGGNWSASVAVKENHSLVVRGPYRFVRHPIYAGMLLAMFGAALVNGEAGCFLAVILGFVGFWIKARREEQFMTEEFGENYRRYQASVKQMIPFLL